MACAASIAYMYIYIYMNTTDYVGPRRCECIIEGMIFKLMTQNIVLGIRC